MKSDLVLYNATIEWHNPQCPKLFYITELRVTEDYREDLAPDRELAGKVVGYTQHGIRRIVSPDSGWTESRDECVARIVKYLTGFKDKYTRIVGCFNRIIEQLNAGLDGGTSEDE
jgi:hypothetical protein